MTGPASTSTRTLLLLRHGEAASGPGRSDRERPLTAAGRSACARAGAWIARHHPELDRVLCSTALRTRQSAAATGLAAPVSFSEAVYGADPEELLHLLRDEDPAHRTLLLVGHAPGLPRLAAELAGSGSDQGALGRLRAGFGPATLAVLAVTGPWWAAGPGCATLLDVRSAG